MTIRIINYVTGLLQILFSIMVTIPLMIKVLITGGGPLGFGITGLALLAPLSAYILFGLAGVIKNESMQRRIFIVAHVTTISMGLIGLFIFVMYPKIILVIPVALAILGIVSKSNFRYYLLVMILLAILANILLLKWELDAGRHLPLIQLFDLSDNIAFWAS